MGEDELALKKAIECGDPDLIFKVIFNVIIGRTFSDLIELLDMHPRARDSFTAYCREVDPELLVELLRSSNSGPERANNLIKTAYSTALSHYQEYLVSNDRNREQKYNSSGHEMRLTLERAIETIGPNKEHAFTRKMIDEAIRLHAPYSVSDAIKIAITAGDIATSLKIKSDFKVPDKRYYWIRIRVHTMQKDWASLEKFSKEKFPPIGFLPFVEECEAAGAPKTETVKYISRIPDLSERASAFEIANMMEQAVAAAEAAKNTTLLDRFRVVAKTYTAQQNINVTSTFEKGFENLRDRLNQAASQSFKYR